MTGITPLASDRYHTADGARSSLRAIAPSLFFYMDMVQIVFSASRAAKRGRYGTPEWAASSVGILRALERVGCRVTAEGIGNIARLDSPCVFIGNHMSTLETFVLPCLIAPFREVTFVVKQSLVEYPVFKHVMRSRDPVTVGRVNPREDLRAVLEEGCDRIRRGISVIVFPQTTRRVDLDPAQFNSIGIKLAKKAGVPVIPLALKTDAWGNGTAFKDFGKIRPERPVRFSFGEALTVQGNGAAEHDAVIDFVSGRLRAWSGD